MVTTKSRLRARRIPTLPKALHARDAIWKGHDDFFSGPIPPVDHAKMLRDTAALSKASVHFWSPQSVLVDPEELVRVLNRAGVRFVLMGAHVTNGWTRVTRTTRDVDVLVQKSHHRKAVEAVRKAFPSFRIEETPVVTRFRDPTDEQVAIDLMKPTHEIHKAVLKNTVRIAGTHDVPILEMALACKFAAMTSPIRSYVKKLQDAADFALIVKHNQDVINRIRLRRLGELIYAGGGDEIVRLAEDVVADRPLRF